MGYLGTWVGYAGLFLALMAVVFLPGYIALRFLRFPRFGSFALAPAWTMAIVGIGAIVLNEGDVGWNRASFVLLSVLVILICAIVRPHVSAVFGADRAPYGAYPRKTTVVAIGLPVAVLLVMLAPILILMDPTVPSWSPDPMFHYNGVNAVLLRENASMFGTMDTNHGIRVAGTVYPSVWHGIVSLVASTGTIVPASHVLAFMVIPIIWVVAMSYLAAKALPYHPIAAMLVPVMLLAFPIFPGYLTVVNGLWPNSLALAATPAVMGAVAAAYHRYRWGGKQNAKEILLLSAAVVAVGVVGVAAAHPSTAFTLGWIAIPAVIMVVVHAMRQRLNAMQGRKGILLTVLVVLAMVAALALAFSSSIVRDYLGRSIPRGWDDVPARLVSALAVWPVGRNPIVLAGASIIMVSAIVIGLRVVIRRRHLYWIALAWVMQTLLILGALFPLGPLTSVAGLWYHNAYRLFAVQVIFLALILALAASEVIGWLSRFATKGAPARSMSAQADVIVRRPAFVGGMAAALIVVLFGASFVYNKPTVYAQAKPKFGADQILKSRAELDFIAHLDDYIPKRSIVVGDPTSGIAYAPAFGPIDSVFSSIVVRNVDVEGKILANGLRSIEYDPRVCQVLNAYGINYYYEDAPITYQGINGAESVPGLHSVDTSNGYFHLVAEVDGARLWQITGCPGRAEAPNWWNVRDRRLPVIQPPLGAAR